MELLASTNNNKGCFLLIRGNVSAGVCGDHRLGGHLAGGIQAGVRERGATASARSDGEGPQQPQDTARVDEVCHRRAPACAPLHPPVLCPVGLRILNPVQILQKRTFYEFSMLVVNGMSIICYRPIS